MKVSLPAFSILMVMAFSSLASSESVTFDSPTYCCFSYVSQPIPRENVIKFKITSSQCSQPAVLFWKKDNSVFCANPWDAWVQSYLKELESY